MRPTRGQAFKSDMVYRRIGSSRQEKARELRGPGGEIWGNIAKRSEGIPGRVRRDLEVAEVDAETSAEAGADRHQHDVVVLQHGHSDAGDNEGLPADA